MFESRRSIRRSAWGVVVAFVFSLLATAPLGLHAHAIGVGELHPDFCTASPDEHRANAPPAIVPEKKSPAAKRCNDCAGCVGGATALPPAITPWVAVAASTHLVVVAQPYVARHEYLVARPRGPPVTG